MLLKFAFGSYEIQTFRWANEIIFISQNVIDNQNNS